MLAVGLVRAYNLVPLFHLMGDSVSNPRIKIRFVTQEYIDHRNDESKLDKKIDNLKEKFSSGKKWVATSSVKKSTLNPVWNELYYFPTNVNAEDKIMEIKCNFIVSIF